MYLYFRFFCGTRILLSAMVKPVAAASSDTILSQKDTCMDFYISQFKKKKKKPPMFIITLFIHRFVILVYSNQTPEYKFLEMVFIYQVFCYRYNT